MQHKDFLMVMAKLPMLCCFVLLLVQCKHSSETSASYPPDSTSIDSTGISTPTAAVDDAYQDEIAQAHDVIEYGGTALDEVYTRLSTFLPFVNVSKLAAISIRVKDSLESQRQTETLTDATDSLIFRPYEIAAYQAMLDYKNLLASGLKIKDKCPSLLQLNRTTAEGDSTSLILPPAGPSTVFKDGKFFFIGGTPFITKVRNDDGDVFYDAKGNPETHFSIETENTDFLLNSITSFKNVKFNVTFGGALESYDSGPIEVNGYGTIIHTFAERIPAFFLTRTALVKAHLIAVILKISPQGLGCVSDQPIPQFACAENLSDQDILGAYIPFESNDVNTSNFKQQKNIWTVDLNGDGIADLAGVSSSYAGEASGVVLAEMLWFVNVNGQWKIIDWGHDLDCT